MSRTNDLVMEEKLKPCPFCGVVPEVHTAERGPFKGLTRVTHRCHVLGYILIQDWCDGIKHAQKWNKRFVPSQP